MKRRHLMISLVIKSDGPSIQPGSIVRSEGIKVDEVSEVPFYCGFTYRALLFRAFHPFKKMAHAKASRYISLCRYPYISIPGFLEKEEMLKRSLFPHTLVVSAGIHNPLGLEPPDTLESRPLDALLELRWQY